MAKLYKFFIFVDMLVQENSMGLGKIKHGCMNQSMPRQRQVGNNLLIMRFKNSLASIRQHNNFPGSKKSPIIFVFKNCFS